MIIAACLLFSKGIQKNIALGLEKLKNKLEYKLEINSLNEKNSMFKFFENSTRALTSIIEKSESMLTLGIPLIGAIATTVISTTKLVSGGKSLALGFVSGICLNFIGKFVDNFRIKYFNKKNH